jgi:hypothetical protein
MLFQEDRLLPYLHTAVRNFLDGIKVFMEMEWQEWPLSLGQLVLTLPLVDCRLGRHVRHAVRLQHSTLLCPNLLGGLLYAPSLQICGLTLSAGYDICGYPRCPE